MELYINTADRETVIVRLGKETKSLSAAHRQAEKLLPAIEALVKKAGKKLADIERIQVEEAGDSFTALRIGVATANALAYALGCPVVPVTGKAARKQGIAAVAPRYSKPPTIHKKKP